MYQSQLFCREQVQSMANIRIPSGINISKTYAHMWGVCVCAVSVYIHTQTHTHIISFLHHALCLTYIVKAMVFPVVMYGCESWIIKEAECQRTDAFELWCWRRLLRVPWTARKSNQLILKEINPEYSLEELKLKLGTRCKESTHWKRS